MNTTLTPVLPGSSQSANSTSPSKPMHPQGAPMSYGQPSGSISQNPFPNTNAAHNHPTTQQNHFSLNVPGGTTPFNMGTIPTSNHPVAISQPSSVGQNYSASKTPTYSSGLGSTTQNQNPLPPVSQTLPATTNSSSTVNTQETLTTQSLSNFSTNSTIDKDFTEEAGKSQLQSNGTTEGDTSEPEKPDTPEEVQANHVTAEDAEASEDLKEETPQTVSPIQTEAPSVKEPEHHAVDEITPIEEDSIEDSSVTAEKPKTVSNAEISENSQKNDTSEISNTPATTVSEANDVTEPANTSVSENVLKETSKPETAQNDINSTKDAADSDPLAIDSVAASEEKSSKQGPESETKNSEEEKSEEDQSSEENSEDQKDEDASEKPSAKAPSRKAKASKPEPKTPIQKSPNIGKAKRHRIRTQPYQSPLPEIEIITKITSTPRRTKANDEKLIYFYKNEFLAVRNAEGGFYLCQAVQNIYKTSSKVKIRWLSLDKNEKGGEIYTPDFYDLTDFDCILTSLDLTKVGKGRYKLKPAEKERTDSILKRCLAVEKGEISQPSVSEEHPDGLDLSLYKDEEQLMKKKSGVKRKSNAASATPKKEIATKKSPETPKVRKVETKPTPAKTSSVVKKTSAPAKKQPAPEPKKTTPSSTRAARGKRKEDPKKSPVLDQKKAKVLAKIGRKTAITVSSSNSSKPQPPKNTKGSKPSPSTSKVTKAPATSSKPPPRKAKRVGRK